MTGKYCTNLQKRTASLSEDLDLRSVRHSEVLEELVQVRVSREIDRGTASAEMDLRGERRAVNISLTTEQMCIPW